MTGDDEPRWRTTRTGATATSFGWRVRLAMSLPPVLWLLSVVGVCASLATREDPRAWAGALFFGGGLLWLAVWWGRHVWSAHRVGGTAAPRVLREVDPAAERGRRATHHALTYLDRQRRDGEDDGDPPGPVAPTRW